MCLGCPSVLSKHLEVSSAHSEDQPCLVQLVLRFLASLQIPHQRMGFSLATKLKGDRLLSVIFQPLFLDGSISPTRPTALTFRNFIYQMV